MNLQIVCADSPVDTTLREEGERQRLIAALGGGPVRSPLTPHNSVPVPSVSVRVGNKSSPLSGPPTSFISNAPSSAPSSVSLLVPPHPLPQSIVTPSTTSVAASSTGRISASAAPQSAPSTLTTSGPVLNFGRSSSVAESVHVIGSEPPVRSSMAMAKVTMPLIVTTTGFSIDETKQLQQLLQSAGHMYTSSLTRQTQIVVAATADSNKYKLAVSNKILVVSPRWVLDFQCASEAVTDTTHNNTIPSALAIAANGLNLHPFVGMVVCSTSLTLKERTELLQHHVVRSFCGMVLQPELDKHCKYLIVPDSWAPLLVYNGYYPKLVTAASTVTTSNGPAQPVAFKDIETVKPEERLGRSSLPLTNASSVSPDSKPTSLSTQQKHLLKAMEGNPKYKFATKHMPTTVMVPLGRFILELVWAQLFEGGDTMAPTNLTQVPILCLPPMRGTNNPPPMPSWLDKAPVDMRGPLLDLAELCYGRGGDCTIRRRSEDHGRRLFVSEGEAPSSRSTTNNSAAPMFRTATAVSLKTLQPPATSVPQPVPPVPAKPPVIYISHDAPRDTASPNHTTPIATAQSALLAEAEQLCSLLGFVRVPTMVRRVTHVIALDPSAVVHRDTLFDENCAGASSNSDTVVVNGGNYSSVPLQRLDSTFLAVRTTRTAVDHPQPTSAASSTDNVRPFSFDIVTIDWLRQSAEQLKAAAAGVPGTSGIVPSLPYLFARPTITFTAMPRQNRKALTSIAVSLGAIVMDDLIVGSLNPDTSITSHLVVGQSATQAEGYPTISGDTLASSKVQAITSRHSTGKSQGCCIVTEAWLRKCQEARSWLPARYPEDAIEDGKGMIAADRVKEPIPRAAVYLAAGASCTTTASVLGEKRPREVPEPLKPMPVPKIEVVQVEEEEETDNSNSIGFIEEDAFAALLMKLDAAVPTTNSGKSSPLMANAAENDFSISLEDTDNVAAIHVVAAPLPPPPPPPPPPLFGHFPPLKGRTMSDMPTPPRPSQMYDSQQVFYRHTDIEEHASQLDPQIRDLLASIRGEATTRADSAPNKARRTEGSGGMGLLGPVGGKSLLNVSSPHPRSSLVVPTIAIPQSESRLPSNSVATSTNVGAANATGQANSKPGFNDIMDIPTPARLPIPSPSVDPAPTQYLFFVTKKAKDLQPNSFDVKVLITSCGGTIVESIAEATHFIPDKVGKTESFLSCVAAGKWLLSPQYVEELNKLAVRRGVTCHLMSAHPPQSCGDVVGTLPMSAAERPPKGTHYFLEEEPFEWSSITGGSSSTSGGGSGRSLNNQPTVSTTGGYGTLFSNASGLYYVSINTLSAACVFQRRSLIRPYALWGVLMVCAAESRGKSFQTVLSSGGCLTTRVVTKTDMRMIAEAWVEEVWERVFGLGEFAGRGKGPLDGGSSEGLVATVATSGASIGAVIPTRTVLFGSRSNPTISPTNSKLTSRQQRLRELLTAHEAYLKSYCESTGPPAKADAPHTIPDDIMVESPLLLAIVGHEDPTIYSVCNKIGVADPVDELLDPVVNNFAFLAIKRILLKIGAPLAREVSEEGDPDRQMAALLNGPGIPRNRAPNVPQHPRDGHFHRSQFPAIPPTMQSLMPFPDLTPTPPWITSLVKNCRGGNIDGMPDPTPTYSATYGPDTHPLAPLFKERDFLASKITHVLAEENIVEKIPVYRAIVARYTGSLSGSGIVVAPLPTDVAAVPPPPPFIDQPLPPHAGQAPPMLRVEYCVHSICVPQPHLDMGRFQFW